ncbi:MULTISPECIES: hypothetical protein [Actinokineospora]|uniref:Uncharacterized protein n=1 Tax=Actinokineospora fastidiosa TaxID=1816 RepID=A0A918LCL6_9PSEU|nr:MULTISPECIES: hypothetical protein [Actinokineospora]UVS79698.1 hypothetical protein Actkin_03448 [Actinokineospora sp. UTMC 2448]GGS30371.1 hypothetical protein GCM10010171_24880 [Actinokineospora fastidiosa]
MADKITFDEEKYNRLVKAMNELENGLLLESTTTPALVLDGDIILQPGKQPWGPASRLVSKGTEFGGSVEQQNELLRKSIVTFANALEIAKEIFKETDDLATYDIADFVAQYPDFNVGGGLGGKPPAA